MNSLKLNDSLYWVGVLDKDLRVFDIIMHTEFGTTYNSYVLKGSEKTALFESAKGIFFEDYLQTVTQITPVEEIEYVIVDHTEPDHVDLDLLHDEQQQKPAQAQAEDGTHNGQHHAAHQSRRHGGVDGAMHILILPTAQRVGHGNTGTYGQTDEQVDHQHGDGTGGTHCRQRDTAAEAAYDDQIGSVEQQLQKTGQDNGNGITDHIF